jgi:hypothetical protein
MMMPDASEPFSRFHEENADQTAFAKALWERVRRECRCGITFYNYVVDESSSRTAHIPAV